jgi:hypothetical protein
MRKVHLLPSLLDPNGSSSFFFAVGPQGNGVEPQAAEQAG